MSIYSLIERNTELETEQTEVPIGKVLNDNLKSRLSIIGSTDFLLHNHRYIYTFMPETRNSSKTEKR